MNTADTTKLLAEMRELNADIKSKTFDDFAQHEVTINEEFRINLELVVEDLNEDYPAYRLAKIKDIKETDNGYSLTFNFNEDFSENTEF